MALCLIRVYCYCVGGGKVSVICTCTYMYMYMQLDVVCDMYNIIGNFCTKHVEEPKVDGKHPHPQVNSKCHIEKIKLRTYKLLLMSL